MVSLLSINILLFRPADTGQSDLAGPVCARTDAADLSKGTLNQLNEP